MSCPSHDRLAAAASGEDALVAAHAEVCERCRALLVEQAAMVALAKRLPAPPLVGARRRTLEALVYAHAETEPHVPASRWRFAPIAIGVVAAAVVTIVALGGRRAAPDLARPAMPPPIARAPAPAPAAAAKPDLVATDADYVRDHQIVQLRAGTLAIDTRGHPPLDVIGAGATVHVGDANVEVVAQKGAIAMVHVFAGSAEVTAAGRRVVVATGDVWVPEPPAAAKPPPRDEPKHVEPPPEPVAVVPEIDPALVVPTSSVERSLADFRTGWTALRAGHNADAIAAFDRATDAVVAEDAVYWAAVASERDGDREGAVRRFRGFIDRFPSSPRIDGARAALARLGR